MPKYFCYDDGKAILLWERWFRQQASKQARGRHATVFGEFIENGHWSKPHAKVIDGGIVQVTINAEVQWRIWGYRSGADEFTVLLIGYHKDRRYVPPDWLSKAKKQKKAIENGTAKRVSCVRPRQI